MSGLVVAGRKGDGSECCEWGLELDWTGDGVWCCWCWSSAGFDDVGDVPVDLSSGMFQADLCCEGIGGPMASGRAGGWLSEGAAYGYLSRWLNVSSMRASPPAELKLTDIVKGRRGGQAKEGWDWLRRKRVLYEERT